jgi:hypothetical protein
LRIADFLFYSIPFDLVNTMRFISVAGVLFAMQSGLAAQVELDSSEPSYGGKTISAWLDEYGAGPGGYKPSPQADDALRHIGPNVAPYLLLLLRATNSHAKEQPMNAAPPPASWDHWKAYLGFQAIGPLGKAALPELVKLAHDPSGGSDPSNTGEAPGVEFWKDTASVAEFANTSATYPWSGPHAFGGTVALTREILVDGEIGAWSLAAIGAEGVPPLMELLTNPSPRLRCRAAVALGLTGGAAEPAVPALIKRMDDPDINTRWEAADALGCIGRRADLAVPVLIKTLEDPSSAMRNIAVKSLGDFGEGATNAIPGLLAFFPSDDGRINEAVALALSKISPDTTAKHIIPGLLRKLQDSNPYFQSEAVATLGQMKLVPDLAIPALIGLADHTNANIRYSAGFWLGSFGPAAKAAVPTLRRLTNDPDNKVSAQAARSLRLIDASPTPVK